MRNITAPPICGVTFNPCDLLTFKGTNQCTAAHILIEVDSRAVQLINVIKVTSEGVPVKPTNVCSELVCAHRFASRADIRRELPKPEFVGVVDTIRSCIASSSSSCAQICTRSLEIKGRLIATVIDRNDAGENSVP